MFKSPSLLADFFSFLFKPKYQQKPDNLPWWQKLWLSFRLLAFVGIFSFIGGLISTAVISEFSSGEVENEVLNLADELGLWFFAFLAIVYAPLTEEVMFRGWLRATPWNLSLGLSLIVSTTLATIESIINFSIKKKAVELMGGTALSESGSALFELMLSLLIVITLIGFFYWLFQTQPKLLQAVENIFKETFGFWFYLSSFSFGLIHIGNFLGIEEIWWLSPLLVLPQIFGGLQLGYIRVKFGIWWAILSHAMSNSIAVMGLAAINSLSEEAQNAAMPEVGSNDYTILLQFSLIFLVLILINFSVNILNVMEIFVSKEPEK